MSFIENFKQSMDKFENLPPHERKLFNERVREKKLTFMQFYEMTSAIGPVDFDYNNMKYNESQYEYFLNAPTTTLKRISATVDLLQDEGEIVALDHKLKMIVFYMQFSVISNNGLKIIGVTSIWRSSASHDTLGLPKQIYFDLLVDTYDGVISDDEQTRRMIERWKTWMQQALEQNLYLYYYDGHVFHKETEVKTLMDKAWGHGKHDVRGVISKRSDLDGKSFNLGDA